jgi:hypothetical protein
MYEQVDYKWDTEEVDEKGEKVLNEKGEKVQAPLPTAKRTLFSALPEHLIFHLKRFDFCFETFATIKYNKRFEFPAELDMYPYTLESVDSTELFGEGATGEGSRVFEKRAKEYYQYQLKGVVVHMGASNSGHYYSYIKERSCTENSAENSVPGRASFGGTDSKEGKDSKDSKDSKEGKERMFEFNDAFVWPFDEHSIEEECFGGEEAHPAGQRQGSNFSREKQRSAFMLIYDRIVAHAPTEGGEEEGSVVRLQDLTPEKSTERSEEEGEGSDEEGGDEEGSFSASKALLKSPARQSRLQAQRMVCEQRAAFPAAMVQQIWTDNTGFWRRKHVLDAKQYFLFINR